MLVHHRGNGVRVVSFAQPDLRLQLDSYGTIEDCELYQELDVRALRSLAAEDRLVLDLRRVRFFTSAFLHLLLKVRQVVCDRQAQLVLCHVQPSHRQVLEVTKTLPLFQIAPDEEEAPGKDHEE
jgi:anti-anti-sigma factor